MTIKIAPSILAADFTRLADAIAQAEAGGADWIHIDVMDGHFVPNISVGVPVVASVRKVTDLPLDVHLMIEDPGRYVEAFANAGADRLTVHQEACGKELPDVLEAIRGQGVRPGVTINPPTPVSVLEPVLPLVDLVLIMTVHAGFGGQSYIPESTQRVARTRGMIDASGREIELEVDGGIAPDTVAEVVGAGASVLVAGAAIFRGAGTVAENIAAIRTAV